MKSKLIALFTIIVLMILIIFVYSFVKTQRSIIATQETSTSIAFSTALYSNSLTQSARPTNTPFVMPKGDFEMSWDIYSSEYNSLGGILTIRKQGSKYTQTLLMSDGSGETGSLSVKVVNGEERLHDDRFDDYYGDFMVIDKNGWLIFYDKQGYIYGVPPLR